MRPRRRYLQGLTRVDRLTAMTRLEEAIGQANGWLLDFHLFSNLAAAFHLEVPPHRLPQLLVALEEAGFSIDVPEAGADLSDSLSTDEEAGEVAVTLQITFLHDEPDLRRESPAIPG